MKANLNHVLILLVLLDAGGGLLAWELAQRAGDARMVLVSPAHGLPPESSTAQEAARLEAISAQLQRLNRLTQSATQQQLDSANRKTAQVAEDLAKKEETIKRTLNEQINGMIATKYSGLFSRLALGEGDRDSLLSLLEKRATDIRMANSESAADEGARAARTREIETATEQKIAALLGEDRYRDYENYRDSLPYKNTISQYKNWLNAEAAPLSADAASRLESALMQGKVADDAALSNTSDEAICRALGVETIPLGEDAIARAKGLLNEDQMSVLVRLNNYNKARRLARAVDRLP